MNEKLRVGFAPFGFYGYPKDVLAARARRSGGGAWAGGRGH